MLIRPCHGCRAAVEAQAAAASGMRAAVEEPERLQLSAADIEQLRAAHAADIEALQAAHAAEIEQLRADHGAEIERLSAAHASELGRLRAAHAAELGMARREAEAAQAMAATVLAAGRRDIATQHPEQGAAREASSSSPSQGERRLQEQLRQVRQGALDWASLDWASSCCVGPAEVGGLFFFMNAHTSTILL